MNHSGHGSKTGKKMKISHFRNKDGYVQFSEIESFYITEIINHIEIVKAQKYGFMSTIDFMAEVRVSYFAILFTVYRQSISATV